MDSLWIRKASGLSGEQAWNGFGVPEIVGGAMSPIL